MTPEARRILAAYARAQRLISAVAATRLRQLWPLLLAGQLGSTAEGWAAAATVAVQSGHERASDLAAVFYRRFGEAESAQVAPVRSRFDPERTRRLMVAAGPGLIRANLSKGLRFDDAAQKAEYWATGAGVRETLSGGRETLRLSVVRDGHRWARAASGNACAFCAMLAARGAVYSEATADFESHVNCACYPVPVFSQGQGLPPNSSMFRQEWERSDGTLQGFRHHLDGVRGPAAADTAAA